jgi:CRISPR-associated endonuclease Csn1
MMKNILGSDLGTNSIGWALVQKEFDKKQGEILGLGSRIIPMTQDVLDNFTREILIQKFKKNALKQASTSK